MYIKVVSCHKAPSGGVVAELQIDQDGLKANSILSSSKSGKRWKVESRVLYSAFREIHKRFPFEKIQVIRTELRDENKEKLKLEMCAKENKKVFQYYIKGVGHKLAPEIDETLLCAGY